MALVDRFIGEDGERRTLEALLGAKLVGGNTELAQAIMDVAEVAPFDAGVSLIEQGGSDNAVYILIAGTCDIIVNGRVVAKRGPGDHVGEMAAIEPTQDRSASVVADTEVVALKIEEPAFHEIARQFPDVYRCVARELARRLLQRNKLVGAYREKIRVFIISSVESLPVARAVQNAFEHDPFHVTIWTDGVFKVANYTLQSLEDEIENSDFAVAIAHADDSTTVRGEAWPTPRDNVVFELGLFMGRLGRSRAILMEPREEAVKLPSDLAGVTTIPYRFGRGDEAESLLGPACNRLRKHIEALGPHNG